MRRKRTRPIKIRSVPTVAKLGTRSTPTSTSEEGNRAEDETRMPGHREPTSTSEKQNQFEILTKQIHYTEFETCAVQI